MSYDFPPDLESDLLQRKTAAEGIIAQGASLDTNTVAQLLSIKRVWPDMPPGAALSFSQAGFTADSPEVQQAAQVAVANTTRQTQNKRALAFMSQQRQSNGPFGSIAKQALDVAGQAATAIGPLSHLAAQSHTPGLAPVGNAVQAGVRTVGLAANTPLQYIQGQVRATAQDVTDIAHGNLSPLNPLSARQTYRHTTEVGQQTQAGQAVSALQQGQRVDIGSGYLPDPNSATGQAAAASARQAAPTINGHAFTLGRYGASLVLEPNSEAYKILSGVIDTAVAFKGDPSAALLGAAGDERAAGRIFTPESPEGTAVAAGLYPTTSAVAVDHSTKTAWLNSPQFTTKFADPVAATSSPAEIWRMSNRALPVETVHGDPLLANLADASTPQAVRDSIQSATQLVGKFDLPGVNYKIRQAADSRLLAMYPDHTIFPNDKNQTLGVLEDIMRGGRVPIPERNKVLDQYIRAAPGTDTTAALSAGMSAIAKRMEMVGIDTKTAENATRFYTQTQHYATLYDLDQATRAERIRDGVVVDGASHAIPTPTLVSEGLNSPITLPSPREIRQMTSFLAPITGTKPWQGTMNVLTSLTQFWKGLAVATARLPIRIFMDSQLSLAAHGYNTAFNHPIDWIAAMVGGNLDKRWAQVANKVPGIDAAYIFGPDGQHILEGTTDDILGGLSRHVDPSQTALDGFIGVSRTDPLAAQGFTEELGRMYADPILRQAATSPNINDLTNWFIHGDGNTLRQKMIARYDDINQRNLAKAATGDYGNATALVADLRTPDGVRSFLQTNYLARLSDTTGGNQELLDAVASGKLAGRNIWRYSPTPDATIVSDTARQRAQELLDAGAGPTAGLVKVRRVLTTGTTDKIAARAIKDNAMSWMFAHLLTLPDRDLNRIPGWGQSVWREAEKYLPYTAPEEYNKVLQAAADANIDPAQLDRLHNITLDGTLRPATKIVDESGRPLRVYHGTTDTFGEFDAARKMYREGDAFYFTSDPKQADFYTQMTSKPDFSPAAHGGPDPQTRMQYLDMRNPWTDPTPGGGAYSNARIAELKAQGYDGIIYHEQNGEGATAYAVFSPDQVHNFSDTIPKESAGQRLNATQLTTLAKADAAKNFENLVHNLYGKSQLGDMLRVVTPFGDAFRKIAQRWISTIVEEPQTLRRLQQGLQAARTPDSGAVSRLFGDPVPQGQGFFHNDPTSGDEVFTIPGTTFLDKSLIGVPLPLTGKVSGLSLVGQGYPGIGGPAITLPAKWFLPDTPGTPNDIKNIIFPNGGGESEGIRTDLGQAVLPPWLQKMTDGAPDQQTFNNTVSAMMRYLASTGDYQLTGPKAATETLRLAADAKDDAKWAYVIRGAVQFTSPASPSFEPLVQDKTGHLAITQVLIDQYRTQQQKLGQDGAMTWLLNTLGPNNIFLAQSGSQPVGYGVPVTKEGTAWAVAHPSVKDAYPSTYGLFAPQGGKFDITAYETQFATGERRTLDAKTQVAQAENRIGLYAYYQKQQQILQANVDAGGTPSFTKAQQTWLSDFKTYLTDQFPGFGSFQANPYDNTKKLNDAVNQLTRAATDRKVNTTDAGRGLQQYLQFRTSAIQAAIDQYGVKTPFKSQSTVALRAWLRGAAQQIIKTHPDFASMWDQVFSRELAEDTTQVAA